ncbi:unannotated protein [freshwater metagenome]|uniref:Unannotated protein n=1 Tax=freshwater metagenome TaxID=449393 RepID=A0A6J5YI90_9ZZZZ
MKVLIRSGKHPFESYSPRAALATNYFSDNMGNLVYQEATHKLLTTSNQSTTSSHRVTDSEHAAWISDHFDVMIVPLANAFRIGYEGTLRRLTELIENLTIPVVILGVGAQAPLGQDFSSLESIRSDVVRFVRSVLARSPSIGVRGELTLNYLTSLGFSEVEVIGCPSMFVHGMELPLRLLPTRIDHQSKIALTVSPYVPGLNELLISSVRDYENLDYFVQDIVTLKMIAHGKSVRANLDYLGMPNYSDHPLFVSHRAKFHFDVTSWRKDIAGYDFSFGTRIHGTIAALTSGTPATLIAHDSRTKELADYFNIPHVDLVTAQTYSSATELAAHWDPTRMVSGHAERFTRFAGFLNMHGLANCFDHPESAVAFDQRQDQIKHSAPFVAGVGTLKNSTLDKAKLAIELMRYAQGRASNPLDRIKFFLKK